LHYIHTIVDKKEEEDKKGKKKALCARWMCMHADMDGWAYGARGWMGGWACGCARWGGMGACVDGGVAGGVCMA